MFITSGVYAQSVNDILDKSKNAAAKLHRAKIKGESVTGGVNTTTSEGVIDYTRKQFYVVEKNGNKIVNSIYFIDNITYMYNGVMEKWFKFGEDLNFFGDMLDKEKLYSFFPEDFAQAGFRLELLAEEAVEGEPCYVISSTIVDKEKAKEFISKFLDKFFSEKIASQIKKNPQMFEQYLDFYVQDSKSTQWISKNTFFVVKVLTKNRQMAGPSESISVENTVFYYDFNKSAKIKLPQEAIAAQVISATDLGM